MEQGAGSSAGNGVKKDLTGQRFGRLVAIRIASLRPTRWECRCDCGNTKSVTTMNLNYGHTKSCGCLFKEMIRERWGKHEAWGHPLYHTWFAMLTRCYNTTTAYYKRYGGRGITVCDRWRNDPHAFFTDMGPKPSPEHSLDRINNDGNYEPSNCRWATLVEQGRNRSVNRYITLNGRTLILTEWAIEIGIDRRVLCKRLSLGWSEERALTQPVRLASKRKHLERSETLNVINEARTP